MRRKILVVDDLATNRLILNKMLCESYEVAEAANGAEALEFLAREGEHVSAVLLDISMPQMDGYEVLRRMRADATLTHIPVIMITASEGEETRVKALSLGANDFVMKPYSAEIIRHCLKNNIALHEAAVTVDALRCDKLTGLYSRDAFFERVRELVDTHEPGYYIMSAFDVNRFKVINDQYGTEKGDEVLRYIARVFDEGFAPNGGICCRISADNFAVLYPASFKDSEQIAETRRRAGVIEGLASPIVFSIGRYLVDDMSMSPSAMYDRATIAAESVKGRYDTRIAFYNESMRDRLIKEQEIVTEMESALIGNQFEIWYQPQYNHTTGAMIGAEALARWRHPQKGLISPGVFVPVFEQNGFIYALDKYIWEGVCAFLRKELDAGRPTLPVSVNVSRYDLFRPDVVEVITGLVKKYELPVSLLRLEVTESAFAESTRHIIEVVRQLMELGFMLEIDDFGSGYSSLNTLKSVPAQVVKLDMRFLEDDDDASRGGNIIESIVRMTKWLGMSVIAEGVETKAQADFLRSIGCNYVQGYLYAKPMPEDEYRALCGKTDAEEELISLETVENLDNNTFWDPKSMDTLIFNSYVGGACIYEYHNGKIELLRATEKYAQVIGSAGMTVEDALKLDWSEHLDAENGRQVIADLDESIATGKEITGEYVFLDLPGCPHKTYLRSAMRVIASADDRYLVYCTNENITEQVEAEQKLHRVSDQMRAIMDNVDAGIIATVVKDDNARYVFTNDFYYEMLGYTRKQFHTEITSPYMTIAPEDRRRIMDETARIRETKASAVLVYTAITRDNRRRHFRSTVSIGRFSGIDEPVQLSILRDITEELEAERREHEAMEQIKAMMDDMPGGFARIQVCDNGEMRPVYINKGLSKLTGMSHDELMALYKDDALAGVHPDDVSIVHEVVEKMMKEGTAHSSRYRLINKSGGYNWFMIFGRVTESTDGKIFLNIYYTDVTREVEEEKTERDLLDNLPGGAGIYELNNNGQMSLTYQNKSYWELVGLNEEAYPDASAMSAVHPDDIQVIMRELSSAIEQHRDVVCDIRLRHLENGYIPVHLVGRIVPKGNGEYSIYTTFTPIPRDTMTYQQMLPLLLSAIMESTSDLSFAKDMELRYLSASRAFANLVGQESADGVIGKTDYDLFGKDLAEKYRHDDETLLATGKPIIDMVESIPSADGAPRYSSTSKYVLRDGDGEIIGLYGVGRDITSAVMSDSQLSLVNDSIPGGLATYVCTPGDFSAENIKITYFNDGFCRLFGLSREEYEKRATSDPMSMVFKDDLHIIEEAWHALMEDNIPTDCIYRAHTGNGGYKWINHRAVAADRQADRVIINAILQDVTEQRELIEQLRISEEESNLAARLGGNVIARYMIADRSLALSPEAAELYALPEKVSNVPHEPINRGMIAPESVDAYIAFFEAIQNGSRSESAIFKHRHLAGWCWLEAKSSTIFSNDGKPVKAVISFTDATEKLRRKVLSETDSLTGVLNRTVFAARVEKIIAASRPDSRHALLMLDIDGFKRVNDVFGHGAGDRALVNIANSLNAVTGDNDFCARLGGDEFMLFVNDAPDDDTIAEKANKLCTIMRKSFSMEVQISGSVGIAIAPQDGTDFETLYKKADCALYNVKGSGKNGYAFYNESMSDEHLIPEADVSIGDTDEKEAEKKRRILIVDDSSIDHAMLKNIFKDEFIVEKARDGKSALVRLRHYGSAISAVLLDLMMPGMNGFEVLENIQGNIELQNIPVIIVSGDESRATCLEAIRKGATDFITKPVDVEILRIRVHSAISKAENQRLRAKNSILEAQNEERIRYEAALESSGITFVEYNWLTGQFVYYPSISKYLFGRYDKRRFWQILLSDMVTDTRTVQDMQYLVHRVAENRVQESSSRVVRLKTPQGTVHSFRMTVRKLMNEYKLTNKLIISLNDLDYEGGHSLEK